MYQECTCECVSSSFPLCNTVCGGLNSNRRWAKHNVIETKLHTFKNNQLKMKTVSRLLFCVRSLYLSLSLHFSPFPALSLSPFINPFLIIMLFIQQTNWWPTFFGWYVEFRLHFLLIYIVLFSSLHFKLIVYLLNQTTNSIALWFGISNVDSTQNVLSTLKY